MKLDANCIFLNLSFIRILYDFFLGKLEFVSALYEQNSLPWRHVSHNIGQSSLPTGRLWCTGWRSDCRLDRQLLQKLPSNVTPSSFFYFLSYQFVDEPGLAGLFATVVMRSRLLFRTKLLLIIIIIFIPHPWCLSDDLEITKASVVHLLII